MISAIGRNHTALHKTEQQKHLNSISTDAPTSIQNLQQQQQYYYLHNYYENIQNNHMIVYYIIYIHIIYNKMKYNEKSNCTILNIYQL